MTPSNFRAALADREERQRQREEEILHRLASLNLQLNSLKEDYQVLSVASGALELRMADTRRQLGHALDQLKDATLARVYDGNLGVIPAVA